jgi:hypothetical protein
MKAVFLFPINGLTFLAIAAALIVLVLIFLVVHAKRIDEQDKPEEGLSNKDEGVNL